MLYSWVTSHKSRGERNFFIFVMEMFRIICFLHTKYYLLLRYKSKHVDESKTRHNETTLSSVICVLLF